MKLSTTSLRPLCFAAALSGLFLTGCARDQAGNSTTLERRSIPLAPIGVASPGIGAPGAGSADTRGTGTIATGEGDTPLDTPTTGSVPASAAGTTPGTRVGGRGRL